jgi:hypothetical protein
MQDFKKENLPMSHGIDLGKKHCPSTNAELETMKKISYDSVIGSIMYALICTRLNVSYALSVISTHQANPGIVHWTTVKKLS